METEITITVTDQTGKILSLADVSEETIRNLRRQCEVIKVPDEICIISGNDNRYCIQTGCQALFYNPTYLSYEVYCWEKPHTRIPCKLTPCKREDLKAGDVAFKTDITTPSVMCLGRYCVILKENKHVSWNDDDVFVRSMNYRYWYKVEAL